MSYKAVARKYILPFLTWFFLITVALGCVAAIAVYAYKDKIVQLFISEANKHLKTEVKVGKISLEFIYTFPEFSIELARVQIPEPVKNADKNMFEAEKMYFTFSLWDLLNQQYRIKNLYVVDATVFLCIDNRGQNNWTIFNKPADTTAKRPLFFNLSGASLQNITISYEDVPLQQFYKGTISKAKTGLKLVGNDWKIAVDGQLRVQNFSIKGWEFFKNKQLNIDGRIDYNEKNKTYTVLPTQIKVLNAEFLMQGYYKDGKKPFVDFTFSEKSSDIQTLVSLLPQKVADPLKPYKSKGNVYFKALLKGEVSRAVKPLIQVEFGCKNAYFYHPDYKVGIDKVSFRGLYNNGDGIRTKPAYLYINDIQAQLENEPLKGYFALTDFNDPLIEASLATTIDLLFLQKIYPITDIDTLAGKAKIYFTYKGRNSALKAKNYANVHFSGQAELENVHVKPKFWKLPLKNTFAKCLFTVPSLQISEFSGQIGSSHLQWSGHIENLLAFALQLQPHVSVIGSLTGKQLHLSQLLNLWESGSNKANGSFILPQTIHANVNVSYPLITYEKHHVKNFACDLQLHPCALNINNMQGRTLNGQFNGRFSSLQRKDSTWWVEADITCEKIKIDSLFIITSNLGQNFITHQNLSGDLYMAAEARYHANKDFSIQWPTLALKSDMKILNGRLKEFAPMKNLSKFVNEQALADIKFAELSNTIQITDGTVFIPEMDIKSNVANITLMGKHGFNQEFEYRLKIPVKNYKRKGIAEEDEAIEGNPFTGMYLYLIIKGNPENFKITYDKAAVKQKIKERWQEEKKEFIEVFKKDYQKKQIEKQKAAEASDDEYFDF